jgi:hypothetical protein
MEHEMQCQIDVVLKVIQCDISVLSIRLKFDFRVSRESEIQREIFKSRLLVINGHFKCAEYSLLLFSICENSLIDIFLLVC